MKKEAFQKPISTIHERFRVALPILILVFHCVYVFFLFLQVPINSDHANQVLEAADMLHGNWLLHGWNLTGVSFYLSELPFYVLSTAIAGVSTWAYIIAAALMVICLSFSGWYLCTRDKSRSIFMMLLFLAITGFPSVKWLGFLRGHCAIFVYFFLIAGLVDSILNSPVVKKRYWIFLAILTVCGTMSDMQLLIIGLVPVLMLCGWNLLRNESLFDRKKTAKTALVILYGTVAGVLLDALLMKLGGINKNSFLDTRSFVNIDALGEKILLLGKGILTVFRCDIPVSSGSIRSFLAVFLTAGILLLTLWRIISVLTQYIRNGEGDVISIILSFSLVLMLAVCLLTDIYTDETSPRYISYMPFAAGVLICRGFNFEKLKKSRLICAGCFLTAGLAFALPVSIKRVETTQDRLAVFLEENDLTEGYSDFWNASSITVASNERVTIRSIRAQVPELGKPDFFEMQNWFCKTEWYETGQPNFIIFDGKGYLHVSEENALILLGEPEKILEFEGYRIYVFARDLSKDIILPADRAK